MTVEITGISLHKGCVTIYCIDTSEENLQRMERLRDDGVEREIIFIFDTRLDKKALDYLYKYVHRQKCTQGAETWGEALRRLIGTHTQSPSSKYRKYE